MKIKVETEESSRTSLEDFFFISGLPSESHNVCAGLYLQGEVCVQRASLTGSKVRGGQRCHSLLLATTTTSLCCLFTTVLKLPGLAHMIHCVAAHFSPPQPWQRVQTIRNTLLDWCLCA